jgi:hypothetical protein
MNNACYYRLSDARESHSLIETKDCSFKCDLIYNLCSCNIRPFIAMVIQNFLISGLLLYKTFYFPIYMVGMRMYWSRYFKEFACFDIPEYENVDIGIPCVCVCVRARAWPLIQFRDLSTQTVGLLGWAISPSQGLYLYTGHKKHKPMIPASKRAKTVIYILL